MTFKICWRVIGIICGIPKIGASSSSCRVFLAPVGQGNAEGAEPLNMRFWVHQVPPKKVQLEVQAQFFADLGKTRETKHKQLV